MHILSKHAELNVQSKMYNAISFTEQVVVLHLGRFLQGHKLFTTVSISSVVLLAILAEKHTYYRMLLRAGGFRMMLRLQRRPPRLLE